MKCVEEPLTRHRWSFSNCCCFQTGSRKYPEVIFHLLLLFLVRNVSAYGPLPASFPISLLSLQHKIQSLELRNHCELCLLFSYRHLLFLIIFYSQSQIALQLKLVTISNLRIQVYQIKPQLIYSTVRNTDLCLSYCFPLSSTPLKPAMCFSAASVVFIFYTENETKAASLEKGMFHW